MRLNRALPIRCPQRLHIDAFVIWFYTGSSGPHTTFLKIFLKRSLNSHTAGIFKTIFLGSVTCWPLLIILNTSQKFRACKVLINGLCALLAFDDQVLVNKSL